MSGVGCTDGGSGAEAAPLGERNRRPTARRPLLCFSEAQDNSASATLNSQHPPCTDDAADVRPTASSGQRLNVRSVGPVLKRRSQQEEEECGSANLTRRLSLFAARDNALLVNDGGTRYRKNAATDPALPRRPRTINIADIPDRDSAFSPLHRSRSQTTDLALGRMTTPRRAPADNRSQTSLGLRYGIMRGFKKRRAFSFHCWVLCPLVLILVSVTIVTIVLGFMAFQTSSRDVLWSLHDLVMANMKVSVGRRTLAKMQRMVVATGSMYFANNTFPSPATDKLMPLENGMMLRLCAVLRDMDSRKTVFALGAVSLTRQQAAICTLSHERPDNFLGVQSRSSVVKAYYRIDLVTLEYENSRVPPPILSDFNIEKYTTTQRFDTVIKIWNDTLRRGEVMKPSQYWVTPHHPPTYLAFVYPFFEVYSDGSTGIGYMFATMFTGDLTGIQMYRANDSGIRVMLVDPNATAERLLVLANNWGQPLSNVTSVWWAVARGEPVRFLHVDDVTDPLMCDALTHVDLRAVISSGQGQTSSFLYDGFDGLISAERIVTESGVEFLLVVVTTRSYYLGSVFVSHGIAIAVGVGALLVVALLFILFVECCLIAPLRTTRSELKLALSGVPLGSVRRGRSVLREVGDLEEECIALRRRLDQLRSYMPHRLIEGDGSGRDGSALASEVVYGVDSGRGPAGDGLRRVTCSVVYVYYTARTTRNPTNTVVELMMQAVVKVATSCCGCFEVQRPDYCVVSFGVRSSGRDCGAEAAQAVVFALQLREELMACADLAGLYHVIVESGTFLSGVISGGGRSHLVLLCRNLHDRIGDFLPHAGVVAAVTEETAVLVPGRFRLLPFETVYLEATGGRYVKLHEVLGGCATSTAWRDYEHCYSGAYGMMERGDYASALCWWDRAKAVERSSLAGEPSSCRSSQAERLRRECLARSERGDTAPFARLPHLADAGEDDAARDAVASTASSDPTAAVDSGSPTESQSDDPAVMLTPSDTVSRGVSAEHLPRQFKDHQGNMWTRSLKPIEDVTTEITPVYMTISSTGTLAVLKVFQLTEAAGHLSRAELETALNGLLYLDANESLVQYLSYCHLAPHHVVLVTQFVPGGTLRELKARYGRPLPLMVVRRNVASILHGLAHLHSRGLVHGRLSPENVMVGVEGRCCVKGMLLGAAPLLVQHGSVYISPEVAAGEARTTASDMYALGLLLLAMLTDSHPWQWVAHVAVNRSRNELESLLSDTAAFCKALRAGQLEPVPPPADVDSTLRTVLEACLCASPEDRPTAECILAMHNL